MAVNVYPSSDQTLFNVLPSKDIESYQVVINKKLDPTITNAVSTELNLVAESDNFESAWSKQALLDQTAKNTVNAFESERAKGNIYASKVESGQVITYGPRVDYEKELQYDKTAAIALGQDPYDRGYDIAGPAEEIRTASIAGQTKNSIELPERQRTVVGDVVNPYRDINSPNGKVDLQDAIGGSDLSVFLLMEVPNVEDLNKPVEVQRKELVFVEIDSCLSLSYSTIREEYPVRRLGNANPVAYTKGIRTIGGHIAFAVFTEDILSRLRGRLKAEMEKAEEAFKSFKSASYRSSSDAQDKYYKFLQTKYNYSRSGLMTAQLLDSLPPFNLLCMGVSEVTGTFSKFIIKGVNIIDENQYQGTQQPNIINKCNFVAEDIIPMHTVPGGGGKFISVNSINSVNESMSKGKFNSSMNYNMEVTGSNLLDSISKDLNKE